MRQSTTRRRRTTFVPQTTVVSLKPAPAISDREAAQKFSALVMPYSQGDLAQASERTKEAAKHWKAGTRCPNGSSLLTLGRRLPIVKDWIISELEVGAPVQGDPNQLMGAVLTGLQMAAQLPGEKGAQARAMLQELSRASGR